MGEDEKNPQDEISGWPGGGVGGGGWESLRLRRQVPAEEKETAGPIGS